MDYNHTVNRVNHRTDKYGLSQLIVRRGQSFNLDVKLGRSFNEDTDSVKLQFTIGESSENCD